MQELKTDLVKPVVTGVEVKGHLIQEQMRPASSVPYLTMSRLTLHTDLLWKLIFRSNFTLQQIESYEVRLSYPKWSWRVSLMWDTLKNKASQEGEKKKKKKPHLPLIYIIQSAILNQHLFIL